MNIILIIVTIATGVLALFSYIEYLAVIAVMVSHEIEPSDEEIKKATVFVIKRLLHI